jgi:hypothetical protein
MTPISNRPDSHQQVSFWPYMILATAMKNLFTCFNQIKQFIKIFFPAKPGAGIQGSGRITGYTIFQSLF